ncbi:mycofactocin biosynthesis peptidyl-dipeptidase MftE [Nocardia sp. NPDC004860]|uniref:mycofactocin biosynthesis peptidyl-dipeptidase MftE n=1 Tax=Nocardia sp. NPDC004860 TaxID=3154557 RepID=UPI0033A35722
MRFPPLSDRIHRTVLAIPLGATEQHGPHLPLDTDTTIAAELCRRLATRRPDIVVAPPIPYGASGEHASFPGTLSIGHRALELLLLELVRSADAFAGVVLVNGHGGNLATLHTIEKTLTAEGRRPLIWSPTGYSTDSHAGHIETSVMLAIDSDSVAMESAQPGDTRPLAEIMPILRQYGVAAVSANGVLGDPTTADHTAGHELLARWTEALVDSVADRIPLFLE